MRRKKSEERFLTCAGRPVRRSERERKSRPAPFGMTISKKLGVEGGLDVGGAVAVEAGGGDGLGKDDADGDEDGAGAGSEGDGDFDAGAFGVLIAAAEAEAAFGEIFAEGDFFLEAAAADAGEGAGLDAGAVAARKDAVFGGRCGEGCGNI